MNSYFRTAIRLPILFSFSLAALLGCTDAPAKPKPVSMATVVATEASAAAIDAADTKAADAKAADALPKRDVAEADRCCQAAGCPCSKTQCLCHDGDRCCEECGCGQDAPPERRTTPFWCASCRQFSFWKALPADKKTKCQWCWRECATRATFKPGNERLYATPFRCQQCGARFQLNAVIHCLKMPCQRCGQWSAYRDDGTVHPYRGAMMIYRGNSGVGSNGTC